jgi:hypothetical protein
MTRTEPAPKPWLHVRCLRPGCGHDAVLDPATLFKTETPPPAPGLSRRFVCRCGGRTAHVSWSLGRPKPDNPCGWL